MRQCYRVQPKMAPKSKNFSSVRTGAENSGKAEKKLLTSFSSPAQILSHIYGVCPFTFYDGKIQFSLFHLIYGTSLVLTTSLARIYLEPSNPNDSFFMNVLHCKNIFMPVSCILSQAFFVGKIKKVIACLNGLFSLWHFMTARQMKQAFYLQIILIIVAYLCFSFVNVLLYFSAPMLFTEKFLIMVLLDYHLSITLWLLKLQFFLCVIFSRNVLICIRRDILRLQTVGTPLQIHPITADLNPIVSLYEKVIKLGESLNECFGVTLGVASLLTALNCITTAYIFVSLQEVRIGWVLISWLAIDFAQEWMMLTAAVLFTQETSRIAIAVHETIRNVQDCHLIEQIAGAVATYMVVLLQFQKTESSAAVANLSRTDV